MFESKITSRVNPTFLLSVIGFICILSGCRAANFQPRPVAEAERPEKPGEAPKAKDGNYQPGDEVALIDNDGKLSIGVVIYGKSGALVFAAHSREGAKEWLPAEQSYTNSYDQATVGKTAPAGYQFEYGARNKYYKWFPPEQVFPAPWAHNASLKIGDAVYRNSAGFRFGEKGIVSELPIKPFGKYRVRFGGSETSTEVDAREIFSSAEPVNPAHLSPGDFVFYDQSFWVMVIGKRDTKIVVRKGSAWKPEDFAVDVSKLQILK